jgi:hypothetical protein
MAEQSGTDFVGCKMSCKSWQMPIPPPKKKAENSWERHQFVFEAVNSQEFGAKTFGG